MTLIKRNELPAALNTIGKDTSVQIYLLFGERYLCREAADLLQKALLNDCPGTVHTIDGDQEDAARTLRLLTTYNLLPGVQIYRVTDSRLLQSKDMGSGLWDKAVREFTAKRPAAALRLLLNMLNLAGISPDAPELFSDLTPEQWRDLFATQKPDSDLEWADRLVREAEVPAGPKEPAANLADRYLEAFGRGLPPNTFLILTADAVDKRKKIFTRIKEKGLIVDCTVETGAGTAAQKVQKEVLVEMIKKTLAGMGKKIEPQALSMLIERIGFQPVAAVVESEKLAFYAGDRSLITGEDLETMVGRSREDALFELTDAFGKRQIARTLVILHHLLEDGTHGLAIVAVLRNYLKKLLIFNSIQHYPTPRWQTGMSAQHFQGKYLPALKELGEWPEMLKGHPYALYMSFCKASDFSQATLIKWLGLVLEAEFRLKGAPLPQHIVLNELLLSMLCTDSR